MSSADIFMSQNPQKDSKTLRGVLQLIQKVRKVTFLVF
jgi:hypothetical protein